MAKKVKYREGDWFSVPLRRGHQAIGLVARVDRHGDSFLGYYFASPRGDQLGPDDVSQLRSEDAVLVGASGTYGFNHGTWRVFHSSTHWDRHAWPIPIFVRVDPSGRKHLETYGDHDVLLPIPAGLQPIDTRIPTGAIKGGLMDAGFVETALWDILKPWGEFANRQPKGDGQLSGPLKPIM